MSNSKLDFLDWLGTLDVTVNKQSSKSPQSMMSPYLFTTDHEFFAEDALVFWVNRWRQNIRILKSQRISKENNCVLPNLNQYSKLMKSIKLWLSFITSGRAVKVGEAHFSRSRQSTLFKFWHTVVRRRLKRRRLNSGIQLLLKFANRMRVNFLMVNFGKWKRRSRLPIVLKQRPTKLLHWGMDGLVAYCRCIKPFREGLQVANRYFQCKQWLAWRRQITHQQTIRYSRDLTLDKAERYLEVASLQRGYYQILSYSRWKLKSKNSWALRRLSNALRARLKECWAAWIHRVQSSRLHKNRRSIIRISSLQEAWLLIRRQWLQRKQVKRWQQVVGLRHHYGTLLRSMLVYKMWIRRLGEYKKNDELSMEWQNNRIVFKGWNRWRETTNSTISNICNSTSIKLLKRADQLTLHKAFLQFRAGIQRQEIRSQITKNSSQFHQKKKLKRAMLILLFKSFLAKQQNAVVSYSLKTMYFHRWFSYFDVQRPLRVALKRAQLRFDFGVTTVAFHWLYRYAQRTILLRRCFKVFRHLHPAPICSRLSALFHAWKTIFIPKSREEKEKFRLVRRRNKLLKLEQLFDIWEEKLTKINIGTFQCSAVLSRLRDLVQKRKQRWKTFQSQLEISHNISSIAPVSFSCIHSRSMALEFGYDNNNNDPFQGSISGIENNFLLRGVLQSSSSSKSFTLVCFLRCYLTQWKLFTRRSRDNRWMAHQEHELAAHRCAHLTHCSLLLKNSTNAKLTSKVLYLWRDAMKRRKIALRRIFLKTRVLPAFQHWSGCYHSAIVRKLHVRGGGEQSTRNGNAFAQSFSLKSLAIRKNDQRKHRQFSFSVDGSALGVVSRDHYIDSNNSRNAGMEELSSFGSVNNGVSGTFSNRHNRNSVEELEECDSLDGSDTDTRKENSILRASIIVEHEEEQQLRTYSGLFDRRTRLLEKTKKHDTFHAMRSSFRQTYRK